jgi:hypothetical protein
MLHRDDRLVKDLARMIWERARKAEIPPLEDAFDTLSQMRKGYIATETGTILQNYLRLAVEVEREVLHTARRQGYFNQENVQ